MNKDKLNEILEKHKLWLAFKKGGKRADLRGTDLGYANLTHANLKFADLTDANLSGAKLCGANLCNANLCNADLYDTDLKGADLSRADLTEADLNYANLRYANLTKADLTDVGLYKADLTYVDLTKTDLTDVDLCGVDLRFIKSVSGIEGYRVISLQMDTTRKNNLIHYWVELDIVTTGCFQGSLQELKNSVAETHKNNDVIRKRYEKAIEFIEYMVEDYKNEKAVNGN